jgi:hypothetical protein
VYLVLSVVWIVVISAVAIRERPASRAVERTKDQPPDAQVYQIGDTQYQFPTTFTHDQILEILVRKGIVPAVAQYWETRSAWAILPPVSGYLVLFGVFPWIGRGFRSTQV